MQGDFQSASIGTFMAINGDGFFVVQKPSSFIDSRPIFDGSDLYTRRGDFQTDKDGFLVNGAGYYLMGIPVDRDHRQPRRAACRSSCNSRTTSCPRSRRRRSSTAPTSPSYPLTPAHDTDMPGSELIDPATFSANPVAGSPAPAKITGFGATLSADATAQLTGTQIVPGRHGERRHVHDQRPGRRRIRPA